MIVAKMLLRPAHKVPTDRTPKPEPGSGRKSAPTGKGTRSPATDMPELSRGSNQGRWCVPRKELKHNKN